MTLKETLLEREISYMDEIRKKISVEIGIKINIIFFI